jgi:hypothetical protein
LDAAAGDNFVSSMLANILIALGLMVSTVTTHAAGFSLLRHRRPWRPGIDQAVAHARAARGIDGHSQVRALDRAFLPARKPVDQQLAEKEPSGWVTESSWRVGRMRVS